MAFSFVVSVAVLACLAMVEGTYVNGRFERSYTDNGFDDSGIFIGDGGILEGGSDDLLMHDMESYVGGGVFNRGIGESLSGGILGSGGVDPEFGASPKYSGMSDIGGGVGGIQQGILGSGSVDSGFGVNPKYAGMSRTGGGIGGLQHGISGGLLGGRRRHFGKFGRRRVSAGLAGFARRPSRVVGMGGVLGVRRRTWKTY